VGVMGMSTCFFTGYPMEMQIIPDKEAHQEENLNTMNLGNFLKMVGEINILLTLFFRITNRY
jgi:hypothetical protein